MRKKKFSLFFLIILVITSLAFGDSLRLKKTDNGKTNSINSGTEIEIVLEGNPTTGYSWDTASFTTNKLQQIGEVQYRQIEQPGRRPRVGMGGQFVFKFKALETGLGGIKLSYRRPWTTTAYDKVYSVVLDIK